VVPDDDVQVEIWHDLYFRAFDALRFDRFYGAMGGEAPISFVAKSRYADDLGLFGEDRLMFQTFLSELDAEYLAWRAEHNKATP